MFTRVSAKSLPPLLETLKDDKVEVRRATILALGRLGKGNFKVEEALRKLLEDPDSLSRVNATVALASIGKADESVIPTLLQALRSKEKPSARLAGKVLGRMGKKSPEKVLPGLLEALDKNQEPVTGYAVQILSSMKTSAVPALPKITALYDNADPETRLDIVDAVTSIDKSGDYAIPVLLKALKADDPLDRNDALLGLLRYRAKSDLYLDHLIGALKDEDAKNRLLAARLIRGLGNKAEKAVPTLITLTRDPDFGVRLSAIHAFGSFKPPPKEILPALESCLQDKNVRIRTAAATALGQLDNTYPEEAAEILEKALKTEKEPHAKARIEATLKRIKRSSPEKMSAVTEKGDHAARRRPH